MKTKINSLYLSLLAGTLLTLGACSKNDDDVAPIEQLPENTGMFVLNEGAFGGASNLGFYSYGTNQYSNSAFTGNLGSGANDLLVYGSKVYISVTDANKVLVLDAKTKAELKVLNISLPRYLLAYKGKVYATSHGENKLFAIDTTSSFSMNSITVGKSPEQLTTTNGKIYVANSGWRDALNGGTYDNHISVVNPTTLTIEKDIVVAENISAIAADTTKNVLYVNASAIYSGSQISKPSKLFIVNTANDQVEGMSFGAEKIVVIPQVKKAYLVSSNRTNDGKNTFCSLDLNTKTVQNITLSNVTVEQPYSLTFIPEIPRLILGDAKNYTSNGQMHVFGLYQSGDLGFDYSLPVGVNPVKFGFTFGSYVMR